jgi:hypothetical protein
VVGDDAQAIYSFRAATVRNILDFPNQFSPPANIITLDRNYRSTQNILAAANGVIGLAAERFTKNLWTDRTSGTKPQLVSVRDEADGARFIVERVLERLSVRLIMCTTVPVVVLPVMMVPRPSPSMMVIGTAPDAERREAGSLVPTRSSCRVKLAQKPRRQTIHQARIPTKFATARRNEANRCAVNVDNRGAGHAAFDAAL